MTSFLQISVAKRYLTSVAMHCREVKMSWFNDSEEQRWICRIMAITFRIAKSLPAGTISRPWVAKHLNRSEEFVKKNWNKDPFNCAMNSAPKEDAISLSQESQQIIVSTLAKEKKSIRKLQKDILDIRGKRRSYGAIRNFLVSLGAKPFHQTRGPKISPKNKKRSFVVLRLPIKLD